MQFNYINSLDTEVRHIINHLLNSKDNAQDYINDVLKSQKLKDKNIAVIGAGVIGLVTAYYLQLSGANVTIYEKESDICLHSSFQNGGQLSFSHIDSISSRKNLFSIFKLNNPINISILSLFDKTFIKFIISYIKNTKPSLRKKNLSIINNLGLISKYVFYNHFITNFGEDNLKKSEYNNNGTIHFFSNKNYFLSKIKHYCDLKINFKILNKNELIEQENSLINVDKLCGGVFFPQDNSINCYKMCCLLKQILQERGVKFCFNNNFTEYSIDYNTQSLQSSYNYNYYIFTSGLGSVDVINKINLWLSYKNSNKYSNKYSVKNKYYNQLVLTKMTGYSFNVDISYSNYAPLLALTDSESRIVYSVQNKYNPSNVIDYNEFVNIINLRVAGFADFISDKQMYKMKDKESSIFNKIFLSRRSKIFKTKRIKLMYNFFIKNFRSLKQSSINSQWIGFRPSTPTSIPIILSGTDIEIKNIAINTGHTNLGLTLSFGSAFIILNKVIKEVESK